MAGALMARIAFLLLPVLGYVGWVGAQTLPDPTRPPTAMMADTGATDIPTQAASGQRLQSVILPQGAKSRALIDGEWREVGQTFGESKLLKIAADRVEIRGPQGRETIRLMPDVDKRAAVIDRGGKTQQGTKK
jgi:MSHA biogenesis protein MshK